MNKKFKAKICFAGAYIANLIGVQWAMCVGQWLDTIPCLIYTILVYLASLITMQIVSSYFNNKTCENIMR